MTAAASASRDLVQLGWTDLALVSLCLLVNAGRSLRYRLAMHRGLLIAGLRTVVQLTLVGYLLQRVFAVEQPLLVAGILVLMTIAAASTIARRSSHAFPGRGLVALGSISFPAFLMVGYGVYFVIRPADWADPRYLIPLMGMVLGNSLIVIMFLLAGATALGSALCVLWLRRRLFDSRERITAALVSREPVPGETSSRG